MFEESKPKRKRAGFIRTSSSKMLETVKNLPKHDSSDEFSSFEYDKKQQIPLTKQDQSSFSPYQENNHLKTFNKPPLPTHKLSQTHAHKLNFILSEEKLKRDKSTGSIRNSSGKRSQREFQKSKQRQEIEDNLAEARKICEKIHKMRLSNSNEKYTQIQKQFSPSPKYQAKLNYNFQPAEQNKNTLNKPHKNKRQIYLPKNYEFSESSLSCNEEAEDSSYRIEPAFEDKKTFYPFSSKEIGRGKSLKGENKIKIKNLIQNQQNSEEEEESDDDENLIEEHNVNDFKTTLKECMEIRNQVRKENNSGVYKSKGGICFEFDINQFARPSKQIEKPKPVVKKAGKVNKKEDILKRRQMAKNYDKFARMRVFGNY